jgi:hypothetical protein
MLPQAYSSSVYFSSVIKVPPNSPPKIEERKRKRKKKLGIMLHSCNPSTPEQRLTQEDFEGGWQFFKTNVRH